MYSILRPCPSRQMILTRRISRWLEVFLSLWAGNHPARYCWRKITGCCHRPPFTGGPGREGGIFPWVPTLGLERQRLCWHHPLRSLCPRIMSHSSTFAAICSIYIEWAPARVSVIFRRICERRAGYLGRNHSDREAKFSPSSICKVWNAVCQIKIFWI